MSRYSNNTDYGRPNYAFEPSRSNVALPGKLKCNMCDKIKTKEHFSNVTLGKVAKMRKENRNLNFERTATVACEFCSPGNRTELQCHECDRTKGLDEFSNGQRRQGENARCKACVMEQHSSVPIGQEDDDDDYGPDSDNDDNENGGVGLHESIANMSVNGSGRTDDGWVEQQPRGYVAPTASSRAPTAATSSSRSNAGSSSIASNASTPARTVIGEQSRPRITAGSATSASRPAARSAQAGTQDPQAKLDMGSESDADSDASSVAF